MRSSLTALFLAAGLTLGVANMSALAQPATDPKAAADAAMKKAIEDAMKKAADEAAKKAAGQTPADVQDAAAKAAAAGQPPEAPKGLPVPSDLPVIKKIELEDGLIAEELKIGDGYEVKPGGAVIAHYHGTLKADGKKFDSSFERGEPAMFPLGQVIPGWQKGVPGMKIGGIRRLTIPAKLGYGERGAGADIPPNSDLVFIIQLIDALQVIEDKEGDGEEVGSQAVSITACTMKTEDGKPLMSSDGKDVGTFTKDHPYIWIPSEMMGVSVGMDGMKVGGKRTIKVPGKMNQSDPRLAGNRPQGVPLTIQIELLAVRNLAPPTPKK